MTAVAVGALPDGTPVIVSGDDDGTVRVWRTADGTPVGEPLARHTGGVTAVAVGALPDGAPVIVSGGDYRDGTVRVWRLADRAPVGEPLAGHDRPVRAVAVGALPDGAPVIVSGDDDGTVRVWRTADGTPVWKRVFSLDASPVLAVAVGALPDGTPVIVSVRGIDIHGGTVVRVWRLADGAPVGEPLGDLDGAVYRGGDRGAAGRHPGHRQRRPRRHGAGVADRRRHPGREPLTGHDSPVTAVATGTLPDGTPVIVSGGHDNTVRVWRTADGTPVGEPLTGHRGPVYAVATGTLPDGTPVIVSGGGDYRDSRVRVWRLADGAPVGEPLADHHGAVTSVAVGALPDGTPVIVSGGADRTVRVRRLADGTPLVPPLNLPESVHVAVYGDVIVTTAGADIAVHQPALQRPAR